MIEAGTGWHQRSLRLRLMVIAVTGLTVGFALGGLALVTTLRVVLVYSIDSEALDEANDVIAMMGPGPLPDPLPATGISEVQVLDGQGQVVAASPEAPHTPVLDPAEVARVRAGEHLVIDGAVIGVEHPVRVVGLAAGADTVVVARDMVDVVRGVAWLSRSLFVFFPLLVGLLAVLGWRVIGATLRPVEQLRRSAAEITGGGGAPLGAAPSLGASAASLGASAPSLGTSPSLVASSAQAARLPVPAAQDEIHDLAVTLNDMLDRLEAGRARQREFAGDAAHELRNPLANMRTQLEVALEVDPGPEWPALARDLLTDTERMSRLVDDLLVLARADDSTTLVNPVPVALAPLLASLAAAAAGPVALGPLDPLWTVAERGAVERIVGNLLANAVRHATSRVVLSLVAAPPGRCVIRVVDDGPGIPVADRERVFERFTRLSDREGGTGLGLPIVRELVRRHRGEVILGDNPAGSGLLVEVYLPRHHPA